MSPLTLQSPAHSSCCENPAQSWRTRAWPDKCSLWGQRPPLPPACKRLGREGCSFCDWSLTYPCRIMCLTPFKYPFPGLLHNSFPIQIFFVVHYDFAYLDPLMLAKSAWLNMFPPQKVEPRVTMCPKFWYVRKSFSLVFMYECPWQVVAILGQSCDLSKFCRKGVPKV